MYNSVQFPLVSQVGIYVDSWSFIVWTETYAIGSVIRSFVWFSEDYFVFDALRIFKVESTFNSFSSFCVSLSRHLILSVLLLHGHPNDTLRRMF